MRKHRTRKRKEKERVRSTLEKQLLRPDLYNIVN